LIVSNKAKFIQCILEDSIDLRNKSSENINILLQNIGMVLIENSCDYLTKMPMNSVSFENVYKLLKEEEEKKAFRID
jgi:hypothetical protein